MGIVFRARDTRLMRDVALKVVPDELAIDPDRLARLTREAQLLASLNHPNIAQIYGLEQTPASASRVIVMELVEGETLHDRLVRGPVPLDEAPHIAQQIVDALEAAHGRGIVHRDLKPANIKLTPDGTVKVLDFGLARLEASGAGESGDALSNSPTITNASMPGVILGTLAYMSPEQARGKVADSRSDIWAFGCVLFEMLSGRQPFTGETGTDIIAHIVTAEPAWDRLPVEVTSPVRTLLAAALTKDPKRRLQHIGDARLFLSAPVVPEAPTSAHARNRFGWGLTAGLAALVAALAIAAFFYTRHGPAAPTETRFEMPAPGFVGDLTISPDGQRLAYVAASEGKPRIWIRPFGSLAAQPLPGTEDATSLFWSPDSRFLGFILFPGGLQKIDVSGGPRQRLADAFVNVPGTWGRDGTILFSSLDRGGPSLVRVPSSGGPVQAVTTTLPPGVGATGLVMPQFLPDGRHFLFVAGRADASGAVLSVLHAGSLDSTATTRLMDLDPWQPGARQGLAFRYVEPGYLLFRRNQTLMAQRFDTARVALTGNAVSLVEGIQEFSASDTGALVYRKSQGEPSAPSGSPQLLWVDRTGKPAGQVALPPNAGDPRLSPDGHRIAVDALEGRNRDIWVIDIARGASSRLTFDPAGEAYPVWAPDSNQIVFSSGRRGSSSQAARSDPNMVNGSELYSKAASGAGADTLLLAGDGGELLIPEDWSADGRYIIFRRVKLTATARVLPDLWALPLFGDRKPFPLVQSPAVKGFARLSPDGRWLAYMTNESGPFQVVVQPFPDSSKGKWQVSTRGAEEMMWRRDGRELFFLAEGKLMAASIRGGDAFEWGSPQALFATPLGLPSSQVGTRANVTTDGQRFLFAIQTAAPASETSSASVPITAVVNWTAALNAR
jgi:Tol biopolymer transport system component